MDWGWVHIDALDEVICEGVELVSLASIIAVFIWTWVCPQQIIQNNVSAPDCYQSAIFLCLYYDWQSFKSSGQTPHICSTDPLTLVYSLSFMNKVLLLKEVWVDIKHGYWQRFSKRHLLELLSWYNSIGVCMQ